jgi:glycosyltransferase involved in cell wall biosynthesis
MPVSVSVIIPTRNRPRQLHAALVTVARQCGLAIEAVVVNDGGVDVRPVIDSVGDAITAKTITLREHRGAAHARNVAVDVAQCDHLAFLDDDDLFLDGHLAAALAELRRTQADLVYAGAFVSDRRLPNAHDYRPDSAARRKCYPFDDNMLMVANYIHTGSVVVRNFSDSAIRFDETLRVCEDWDMWLSLRHTLGFTFSHIDRVTTVYHQVAGDRGLVRSAEAEAASPFSRIRSMLYRKWAVEDEQVLAARRWLSALDVRSNELARTGAGVPRALFDEALDVLADSFATRNTPSAVQLDEVFERAER